MTNYFNEADYKRWLRQYQINLANYIEHFNLLRLRIDDMSSMPVEDPSIVEEGLQAVMDEIDVHLDAVIPRDFSEGAKPLEDSEKFFENGKVICGMLFSLFKRPDPFVSIYQLEKNRVIKEHANFNFKSKLLELKRMIELQVEKNRVITESATFKLKEKLLELKKK